MSEENARYNLVKDIFDHQLRVTEHEDNKAGRIILSISFISSASASIFNLFFNNNINFYLWKIDLITTLFTVAITSTIIGVAIILIGIGPTITNNKKVEEEPYCPTSIFYFVNICKEDINKFKGRFFRLLEPTDRYDLSCIKWYDKKRVN